MKLFALCIASIHGKFYLPATGTWKPGCYWILTGAGLECYAEQDKFDLGHSDLEIRPQCDPNNSRLYAEVQCNSSTCTCTDTVTGAPSAPTRSANVVAKALLKCSGTKVWTWYTLERNFPLQCLAQSKTAQQLAEQGIMDAMGPECDVMGNYKLVQCSFAFCSCQDRTGNYVLIEHHIEIENHLLKRAFDRAIYNS